MFIADSQMSSEENLVWKRVSRSLRRISRFLVLEFYHQGSNLKLCAHVHNLSSRQRNIVTIYKLISLHKFLFKLRYCMLSINILHILVEIVYASSVFSQEHYNYCDQRTDKISSWLNQRKAQHKSVLSTAIDGSPTLTDLWA